MLLKSWHPDTSLTLHFTIFPCNHFPFAKKKDGFKYNFSMDKVNFFLLP